MEEQQQSDFNKLVITTFERIDNTLGRVEEKVDHVTTRIDSLIDTTNHRLDDFHTALNSKAEKTELVVPVIKRWLDTWPKRFIALTAGITTLATIVVAAYTDVWPEFIRMIT